MGWVDDLTPEERSLLAKIGTEASWAKTKDRRKRTAPARSANFQRFRDQVDPNHELTPELRDQLAVHAERAHMLRLSLKAATAARKRREAAQREGP
jgi:hypothetical protein